MGFRRPLRVWEEEEANRLFNLLFNAPSLCPTRSNKLKWGADPAAFFTVYQFYNWIESHLGPIIPVAASIWNNFAPPKVQSFGWLAWLGKIKTSNFLHRIGILLGNANLDCVFCHNEVEIVEHLLLYCPFVSLLWSNIVRWWGMQWVLPGSVTGLLRWWSSCRMKKLEKKIWMVLPLEALK
ncbi:uncharacterized protein LOC114264103 [Camellia sinensis]|uniref:uncharacterized protein LOC114264103 n=1 Tax=Camellia sinensis TaxID=4442 RepID=UPI0010367B86|nr:uncharacterized protein LOC114264103 [Camellia sinensis]